MRPTRPARPESGVAMLAPWLVGLVLVHLAPLAGLCLLSVSRWDGLGASPAVWVGAENWRSLSGDAVLRKALENSLAFVAMNVPVQVAVGLALALLAHHARRRRMWAVLFYSPHALAGVATILVWWWLLNPNVGPMNYAIEAGIYSANTARGLIGLSPLDGRPPLWLFSPAWAKPALVLMNAWQAGGTMLVFLAGLAAMRIDLHEAAALDGAGATRRFWHVTLPHLSPLILLNAVSGAAFSMLAFNQPFMLSNFQQEDSLLFYMYYLYQVAFEQNRVGYAATLSLLLLAILLGLTAAAVWAARRWVHFGREGEPA